LISPFPIACESVQWSIEAVIHNAWNEYFKGVGNSLFVITGGNASGGQPPLDLPNSGPKPRGNTGKDSGWAIKVLMQEIIH
jgi:hypothetical protein